MTISPEGEQEQEAPPSVATTITTMSGSASSMEECPSDESDQDQPKSMSMSSDEPPMETPRKVKPNDEAALDNPHHLGSNNTTTALPFTPGKPKRTAMHVLFLSSDTGGGHRASAESLGNQFQLLFPGTTYDLLDVVKEDGVPPYNSLVSYYQHLSAHPTQWKLVYSVSNSRAFEMLADAHLKLMCERAVRKRILSYQADVVVSVHPLMTNVPVLSCQKISHETGRHLPMFTVVTDLGSAHCLWFANGVEKMFVGSEKVRDLAMQRGRVGPDKLRLLGLPIRHDFALQADSLGERKSPEGRAYQRHVRKELELPCVDRTTILVMGGGEGVGSLSNIVEALYVELVTQGIDALILVVCGRNEKLQRSMETRDWTDVLVRWRAVKENHVSLSSGIMGFRDSCIGGGGVGAAVSGVDPIAQLQNVGCMDGTGGIASLGTGTVTGSIRRMLSRGSLVDAVYTPLPDKSAELSTADINTNNSIKDDTNTASAEEEKKASDADQIVLETQPCGQMEVVLPKTIPIDATGTTDMAAATSSTEQQQPLNGEGNASENTKRLAHSQTLEGKTPGDVTVVGLGFVTRMAEYMVAADVLVSKAGPGTISEAAAVSLPIMLTSFLPGQEEGNVDYVIDGGFGAYVADSDPIAIAEEVCMWLTDETKLSQLSTAAKAKGAPHAARDIVQVIGDSTLKWMELNDEKTARSATKKRNTKQQREAADEVVAEEQQPSPQEPLPPKQQQANSQAI